MRFIFKNILSYTLYKMNIYKEIKVKDVIVFYENETHYIFHTKVGSSYFSKEHWKFLYMSSGKEKTEKEINFYYGGIERSEKLFELKSRDIWKEEELIKRYRRLSHD